MQTQIKLLIILDSLIPDSEKIPNVPSKEDIEKALQRQKKDYEDASGSSVTVVWDYVRKDLSLIPWVNSQWGENYKFISPQWVRDNTKNLGDYYSIAYVFPFTTWKADAISGWSMGFYNGYHIQLIRGMGFNNTVNPIYSMYVTFLEELFHGWDEFFWYELGFSLETLFNVKDFDEEVVHGHRWDYLPFIEKIVPYLLQIFGEEEMKLYIDNNKRVWATQNGVSFWVLDPDTRDDLIRACGNPEPKEVVEGEYVSALVSARTDKPK